MRDVEIGVITSACGIRGEVKVKSFAEDPSRFRKLSVVALSRKGPEAGEDHEIEKVRTSGGMIVLKLKGVGDRNTAETLKGCAIYMDRSDLEELPEGVHYIRDLIGLEVMSSDTGKKIGVVSDILTDRPQDIYVVRKDDGSEFMIPSVPEFIREVDEAEGVIRVKLIEGLE